MRSFAMRVFFSTLTLISSTLAMQAHDVGSKPPEGASSLLYPSFIEQAVVKFFMVGHLIKLVKV